MIQIHLSLELHNSGTLSCYKTTALTSSYSNGELVLKLLNDLLQIKTAVQCCLQDTLSCSSVQSKISIFRACPSNFTATNKLLCSAESHTDYTTQLDSAVETVETLFWENDNFTIGQSCNYLRHYVLPKFSIRNGIRNMEN